MYCVYVCHDSCNGKYMTVISCSVTNTFYGIVLTNASSVEVCRKTVSKNTYHCLLPSGYGIHYYDEILSGGQRYKSSVRVLFCHHHYCRSFTEKGRAHRFAILYNT